MLNRRSLWHTLYFLLGFSLIFISLGFGTSFLGRLFADYQDAIRQIGAVVIVAFGLVVAGLWRPAFLLKDRRISFRERPSGYAGSVLIGMAFAAGWTPCMGPILVAVIALAAANPGSGMLYMLAYTLGFALPFFILSFFIGKLQWIRRHSASLMKAGGYVMMAMGVVLYFDWMTKIIAYTTSLFGGFTGF